MNLVISNNVLPSELNNDRFAEYEVISNIGELSELIKTKPKVYDTIYIDDMSIGFESVSLNALYRVLTNGFINFEFLVYITTAKRDDATTVFNNIFKGIKFEIVNVSKVSNNSVTSVINGSSGNENRKVVTVVSKIKLDEYIRNNGSNKLKSKIEAIDPHVETIKKDEISEERSKVVINVIMTDKLSTSVFLSTVYNNLKLNNRVFCMEFDEFNYYSDYLYRLGESSYITDIDSIDETKSCILLRDKATKIQYNTIFDYIYNTTNFDFYLRVIPIDEVTTELRNMYFIITPTSDNVLKLLSLMHEFSNRRVQIVLLYKGFIGINELKPEEVVTALKSVSNVIPEITAYIMQDKSMYDGGSK